MKKAEALEKLKDAIRLRHFSSATEKSYAHWLQSYMTAVRKFPANWPAEKKGEIGVREIGGRQQLLTGY